MSPQVATVSIEQIYFEFDNLNIEKTHFYLHTQMILITLRTYVYANRDVCDINAAPNSIDYFKCHILL